MLIDFRSVPCIKCKHCLILKTGGVTCPAFDGQWVSDEILNSSPRENCGKGYGFRELSENKLEKRLEALRKIADAR